MDESALISPAPLASLLHGVPVLIKDNIATHEPDLEATAGSLAFVGARPARENAAVTRLRAAGCVLLGTTNCSEWANFRSSPSDSGWSARGGQTYGAYHDRQGPSGSSSGSGVAVDMGFCVLAIGTEVGGPSPREPDMMERLTDGQTSGSIIGPSAENGIVGLKPTVGLVSRDAVIPISPVQDTLGPMARTVADAAATLTIMAGRDENDPKTAEIPFDTIPDYRAASLEALPAHRPLRLGILRDALEELSKDTLDVFESRIVAPLRDCGPQRVALVDCSLPCLERFRALTPDEKTNYMAGEFHDALLAYMASLTSNPQKIDSLEDLCTFLKTEPGEEYGEEDEDAKVEKEAGVTTSVAATAADTGAEAERPRRNISLIEQAVRVTRDSPEFAAARANAAYFAGPGGIQGALDGRKGPAGRPEDVNEHEPVDALLLPTEASMVNYFAGCEGHPQVTIPLGYRSGDTAVLFNDTGRLVRVGPNMPFGVSVIGRKYSEATTLLPICTALEALVHARDEAEARRLPRYRD